MEDRHLFDAYNLLLKELARWFEAAVRMLPNLIVAGIVLFIFYFSAISAKKISLKIMGRISDNKAVTKLLGTISYLIVLFSGLFIALGILNLDKTVTSLLAGAGVIGLVLGFAFQELSSNFISGIYIAFIKPFGVDDVIKSGEHLGKVEYIDLRATVIRTFQGQDVYIPNKLLLTEPVINYTNDPRRRLEIEVGVSYSDDLQKAEEVIYRALKEFDGCDYPSETKVFYRGFGSSSINLIVRYWIKFPGEDNFFRSTHAAVKKIKAAFDEEGITIPFPIRTIDLGIEPTKTLITNLSRDRGVLAAANERAQLE